jgi:hypothetical protein
MSIIEIPVRVNIEHSIAGSDFGDFGGEAAVGNPVTGMRWLCSC